MKKRVLALGALSALILALLGMASVEAADEALAPQQNGAALLPQLKLRVVNFKTCIEESKLGKQEQANFDGLKKQLDGLLEQKDKELQDVAAKLNDLDYLDSLSSEAENELKHKFRTLSQEISQHQNFYMQTLNQTNMRVMQKLNDAIQEAAQKVAQRQGFDLVLNEEMSFFHDKQLDISKEVIALMDEAFDKGHK